MRPDRWYIRLSCCSCISISSASSSLTTRNKHHAHHKCVLGRFHDARDGRERARSYMPRSISGEYARFEWIMSLEYTSTTHDQDNDGAVQRVPDQPEPVASCVLCDLQRYASECHRWMRERGQGGDGAGARVGPSQSRRSVSVAPTSRLRLWESRTSSAHRLPTLLLAFMRRHRATHLRSWRTHSLGDKSCSISSRNPRYIMYIPTRVLLPHANHRSRSLSLISMNRYSSSKERTECKALEKRITHGLDLSQAHQGSSNQCASTPTHRTTSARHTIASSKENECCN